MAPRTFHTVLSFVGCFACYWIARNIFGWPMLGASAFSIVGLFGAPLLVAGFGMMLFGMMASRTSEGRAQLDAYKRMQRDARSRWDELQAQKRAGQTPDPDEEAALQKFLFDE